MSNPLLEKNYCVTIEGILLVNSPPPVISTCSEGSSVTITSTPTPNTDRTALPFELEIPRTEVYETIQNCKAPTIVRRELVALCVVDDLTALGVEVPEGIRKHLMQKAQASLTGAFPRTNQRRIPKALLLTWVEYYHRFHPYRRPTMWDMIRQE